MYLKTKATKIVTTGDPEICMDCTSNCMGGCEFGCTSTCGSTCTGLAIISM